MAQIFLDFFMFGPLCRPVSEPYTQEYLAAYFLRLYGTPPLLLQASGPTIVRLVKGLTQS